MARYTGPRCRLCRREGDKLYLKGHRCNTDKCSFERRKYAPGEHGRGFRKKISDYGIHLREKQKARRIYGIMEKQFRNYFKLADKKSGVTGEILFQLLERRLDNVLYRCGFAPSRIAARQLISHGHVKVDNRKVDISSYLLKPGQEISISEKSRGLNLVQDALAASTDTSKYEWIEVDKDNFKGRFAAVPSFHQIPVEIDERLIVEYYSK